MTIQLPLLPLRNLTVFPGFIYPLMVGRRKSVETIESAMKSNSEVMLSTQKNLKAEISEIDDVFQIGAIASIRNVTHMADGQLRVVLLTEARARIVRFNDSPECTMVAVERVPDVSEDSEPENGIIETVKKTLERYYELKKWKHLNLQSFPEENNLSSLSDFLIREGMWQSLAVKDLQRLLEETRPSWRVRQIHGAMLAYLYKANLVDSSLAEVESWLASDTSEEDKNSVLLNAVSCSEKSDLIALLLKHGANPNARNEQHGNSALHVAACNPDHRVAELLLTHGADVNARDLSGNTAMRAAVFCGLKNIVEILLTYGANPNLSNDDGATPLHNASSSGFKEAVQLLLRNRVAAKGATSPATLVRAFIKGQNEIAQMLLENGAEINAKDREGRTPLALAKKARRKKMVTLLLSHGAK